MKRIWNFSWCFFSFEERVDVKIKILVFSKEVVQYHLLDLLLNESLTNFMDWATRNGS